MPALSVRRLLNRVLTCTRSPKHTAIAQTARLSVEPLDNRLMPSVSMTSVAGNGDRISLDHQGVLREATPSGDIVLGTGVRKFGVNGAGHVVALDAAGLWEARAPRSGSGADWARLGGTEVRDFAVNGPGDVVVLETDGDLWEAKVALSGDGANWVRLGTGVQSAAVNRLGHVVALETDGDVWEAKVHRSADGANWMKIDWGARALAVNGAGDVVTLHDGGEVWEAKVPLSAATADWVKVDWGARAFGVNVSGNVVTLHDGGEAWEAKVPRSAATADWTRAKDTYAFVVGSELVISGTETSDVISVAEANDQVGVANYTIFQDGMTLGAVGTGGIATITAFGLGGNDAIDVSRTTTRLAVVYGGAGNDTLTGYTGRDALFGESGADVLNLRLDLGRFLAGDLRSWTGYADAVGDTVNLTVRLGDALTRAGGWIHDYLVPKLRPVTDLLNTSLVSIAEFQLDLKVRDVVGHVPVLAKLVQVYDELVALDRTLAALPWNDSWVGIGTFEIGATTIRAVSSDPLSELAETTGMKYLASRGIAFPLLTDSTQLARAAVGGVADLVTVDVRLSQFFGGNALEARQTIYEGVYAVGPVPVQYWVDLFGRLDFAVRGGLDTRGFASGSVERGLFLQDLRLTTTGGVGFRTGWRADQIVQSLSSYASSVTGITISKAEFSIGGDLALSQSWVLNNAGGKVYLFGTPGLTPTLRVTNSLTGTLVLTAEFQVKATGWAEELIAGANEVLEDAAQAYYDVTETLKDIWGKITGTNTKKERRPEWEIEKELTWGDSIMLTGYSHDINTLKVL